MQQLLQKEANHLKEEELEYLVLKKLENILRDYNSLSKEKIKERLICLYELVERASDM